MNLPITPLYRDEERDGERMSDIEGKTARGCDSVLCAESLVPLSSFEEQRGLGDVYKVASLLEYQIVCMCICVC